MLCVKDARPNPGPSSVNVSLCNGAHKNRRSHNTLALAISGQFRPSLAGELGEPS